MEADKLQSVYQDPTRFISLLRTVGIAAIVLLHAQTVFVGDVNVAWFDRFVQEWFDSWLLRVGLPILSAISGFLFFRFVQGTVSANRRVFVRKVRQRAGTLLIPFGAVGLLTIGFYAVVQLAPPAQGFFAPPLIKDWSLAEWWQKLFVEPLNYPLYFLRDLFAVVVLAPLIWPIIRFRPTAVLLTMALFVCWWMQLDVLIWNIRLLFWFVVGAYCSQHVKQFPAVPLTGLLVLSVLWCGLSAYGAVDALATLERSRDLNNGCKLLGIFLAVQWLGQLRLDGSLAQWLGRFSLACFPVFLFHNPIVNFSKKIGMKILGDFAPGLPTMVSLLAATIALVSIAFVLVPIGNRYGGKVWQILVGGRTRHRTAVAAMPLNSQAA